MRRPRSISVIIPTYNRASLLERSLESLTEQTLPRDSFEVVVVDDGSSDWTQSVCTKLADRVPLRYFRIENSGISAAKNLGVFAAQRSPAALLRRRRRRRPRASRGARGGAPRAARRERRGSRVHDLGPRARGHPDHGVRHRDRAAAVLVQEPRGRPAARLHVLLGRTIFLQTVAFDHLRVVRPGLPIDHRGHGARLPPRQAGTHRHPHSRREELHGAPGDLRSVGRPMREARTSPMAFAQLHPDPAVERYCRVEEALERWPRLEPQLEAKADRVRELERSHTESGELEQEEWAELQELYGWTLEAFQVRGVAEAAAEESDGATRRPRSALPRRRRSARSRSSSSARRGLVRASWPGRSRSTASSGPRPSPTSSTTCSGTGTWRTPTRRRSPARTAPGCATTAWTWKRSSPISAWA